jgi:hypothetical protein
MSARIEGGNPVCEQCERERFAAAAEAAKRMAADGLPENFGEGEVM